ncbi:hypothetical protein ASPWEDRAFT_42610 [Aspergillus wentii DTO 134E9]|uniref:Major facilitator superfamily (MFS) profile domain-containing protein n=1 Tax=Aspergillus wentii DTO 134E9 TaxID=1073089 RepID=A0A1L9RCF6_ASPWE|nr:uncharacterized protein ASPWEDRAFT_42610 [Aspergillus wentii DTO 134E9]OJJ32594.1 hypothetical protein ASPWEDRAFT_42610 [Aspergillus wentii DTO 134E9]
MIPSFGFQTAIGTIQDYVGTHQLSTYSTSDIGWIFAVLPFLTLFIGVQVGPLFDRYGPRLLLLCGCTASFLSHLLLAQCSRYWHFILCLSLCQGLGSAIVSTVAIAALSHWFNKRRGFASGVCMGGSSFGGAILPISLRYLFPTCGWMWSIRIIALISLICYSVGIFLVKARLSPGESVGKATIDVRAFASARFSFLTVAVFSFEFIIFGCAALLPTYVRYAGFSSDTQFYSLTVLNSCSFLGRTIPGLLADKIGRFNILSVLVVTTLGIMAGVWLPVGSSSEVTLYVVVAIFGFGSGGFISLAPVCAGQLCSTSEYGRYYGTIYSVAAFGALLTTPIGGQLLQSTTPHVLIGFYSAVLVVGLACLSVSRWALLDWKWQWKVKV